MRRALAFLIVTAAVTAGCVKPGTPEARCRAAIDAVAAEGLHPAPGFRLECGPAYETGRDGVTDFQWRGTVYSGVHRIHPDRTDNDARWRDVVRHEIGHGHCLPDQTEACANGFMTGR